MRKVYDFIVKVLSRIPVDKYIHCILLMLLASVFMHTLPIATLWVRLVVSVALSVVVGIGKELYDKKDYGLFDWADVRADAIGAILGSLMSI